MGKLVNFDHILYDFSELSDQNDLIPLEYCQASSDTSLEYPHGVVWWKLKITIFGLAPSPDKFKAKNLVYSQNLLSEVDLSTKKDFKDT